MVLLYVYALTTMNKKIWTGCLAGWLCLLASCTPTEPTADIVLDEIPTIFPDYVGVTIPCNVAPMRFMLEEPDVEAATAVIGTGKEQLIVKAKDENAFLIPEKDWKSLMSSVQGDSLPVKIYTRKDGTWRSYQPFYWHVSNTEVDPYLVYRLIAPGYVLWHRMGIYQRNLTSFVEEAVLTNDQTGYNCMNCHSFNSRNPDRMLFHMREKFAGTYVASPQRVDKLGTVLVGGKPQSLVYPSWHPSGHYVAFSINQTRQAFHMNDRNRVEVMDLSSDVAVYDLERGQLLTDSLLMSPNAFETFPAFSPDGKTLYFCSAASKEMPRDFDQVKYNLCAVSFDESTGQVGHRVDTLYNSHTEHGSVSFPRFSPDGRFLAFTVSGYGNFSIWHKDADLWLMDLKENKSENMSVANSDDVESYHSWSSNGRWMVFSSRRLDGLYTHPYLVYVDKEGKCGKPFVIPQAHPSFYRNLMYSFNIPELVTGKVKLDKKELQKFLQQE